MSWHVIEVPVQYVHQTWPKVEKFLLDSVKYSHGDLTIEETKLHVTNGNWSLLIAVDAENNVKGASTVSYYNRTSDRVAYVTNIGGRLLADKETFAKFCDILKANGATCIEGAVRDSLVRLWARLGAQKKSTTVYIPLS